MEQGVRMYRLTFVLKCGKLILRGDS